MKPIKYKTVRMPHGYFGGGVQTTNRVQYEWNSECDNNRSKRQLGSRTYTHTPSNEAGVHRGEYGGGYSMQVTQQVRLAEEECKREAMYAQQSPATARD